MPFIFDDHYQKRKTDKLVANALNAPDSFLKLLDLMNNHPEHILLVLKRSDCKTVLTKPREVALPHWILSITPEQSTVRFFLSDQQYRASLTEDEISYLERNHLEPQSSAPKKG